jgi:pimeloyl-ACP methyl ester carboxylesterase
MVGTDSVAEAAPDGYTVGVSVVGPLVDNKHPCKKMPCDRAGLTASFGEMTQSPEPRLRRDSGVVASLSWAFARRAERRDTPDGSPDSICQERWRQHRLSSDRKRSDRLGSGSRLGLELDVFWEEPRLERLLTRLASFSRLILFDKRGTGLSDRVSDMPSLEVRMDDVRAVMDAVGSERAALVRLFGGRRDVHPVRRHYPDRASALILGGAFARRTSAPDYPWAPAAEQQLAAIEQIEAGLGRVGRHRSSLAKLGDDARYRQWWARWLRSSASPAAATTLMRMNMEIDVRHVLPAVRVPTLILHSINDRLIDIGASRYMAAHIPGAKLVEMSGIDHIPWGSDSELIVDEIEEFLTGARRGAEPDRVLATVLFTDIVGATERASRVGDRNWHDLLDSHHALVRRELERFRGREIDTAGDGFLATFDGPARAVRCACSISEAVRGARPRDSRRPAHRRVRIDGRQTRRNRGHTGARVAAEANGR